MTFILWSVFWISVVCLVIGWRDPGKFNNSFKGNATRKKIGLTFGIIALATFFAAIALSNSNSFVSTTQPAQTSSPAPTTKPSTPAPAPTPAQPKIGDQAYLRLPNNTDPSQVIMLAIEKSDYDAVLKALMANDTFGLFQLASDNKAFGVSNGTKVLVVDSAAGIRKVRILQGVRSVDDDKVGMAGWVAMEWVVSK